MVFYCNLYKTKQTAKPLKTKFSIGVCFLLILRHWPQLLQLFLFINLPFFCLWGELLYPSRGFESPILFQLSEILIAYFFSHSSPLITAQHDPNPNPNISKKHPLPRPQKPPLDGIRRIEQGSMRRCSKGRRWSEKRKTSGTKKWRSWRLRGQGGLRKHFWSQHLMSRISRMMKLWDLWRLRIKNHLMSGS